MRIINDHPRRLGPILEVIRALYTAGYHVQVWTDEQVGEDRVGVIVWVDAVDYWFQLGTGDERILLRDVREVVVAA